MVYHTKELFSKNGIAATKVDCRRRWGADDFRVVEVVIVTAEDNDGGLKLAIEEVVFEQNAVRKGLMTTFDLALG